MNTWYVIGGLIALVIVFVLLVNLRDIRRYLRIRSMSTRRVK